ncbi:MAG: hypothetical protein JOZ58_08770 [Acetobacteraceae bacterium]|nr:hypothetical protein [Acetobacteraceae bacterium]
MAGAHLGDERGAVNLAFCLRSLRAWRLGAALIVAACGGPPWALSQSPDGVDLRWYPDDTPSAAADAAAQVHCQSFGKNAELIAYTKDGSAQLGRYRCR